MNNIVVIASILAHISGMYRSGPVWSSPNQVLFRLNPGMKWRVGRPKKEVMANAMSGPVRSSSVQISRRSRSSQSILFQAGAGLVQSAPVRLARRSGP